GMGGTAQMARAEQQAYFMTAVNGLYGGKGIPVPGGVLLRDKKGGVVGAVGVTGDTSDNDLIAAMAGKGVELAAGIVIDSQFGPLVMVAAGGVLIEIMHDRRFLLPPAGRASARRAVDGLACRPLLDGVRGASASNVDAVVDAVTALASIAGTLGDLIAEFDVNPLIAGPDGCVAVDALVVPRV
ncbi:MAG: hypothetical protein HN577_13070, partial [Rhodospirillaceae bacterium]|nr:hypothetical protein [Rhodospirillaceae bacterium]